MLLLCCPPRGVRFQANKVADPAARLPLLCPLPGIIPPTVRWIARIARLQTQELKLEDGTAIIIARVKVPTPKGISGCAAAFAPSSLLIRAALTSQLCTFILRKHRHIIRRFDTEALSASSLFRVAFPMATEEAEWAHFPTPSLYPAYFMVLSECLSPIPS